MARKQKILLHYSLFSLVIFVTVIFAMCIALALNKRQQVFLTEAQHLSTNTTLFATPDAVAAPESIRVMINISKPSTIDWIGLYSENQQSQNPISKKYLKDCELRQQKSGESIGYCEFIIPYGGMTYQLRLYRNNTLISYSNSVTASISQ